MTAAKLDPITDDDLRDLEARYLASQDRDLPGRYERIIYMERSAMLWLLQLIARIRADAEKLRVAVEALEWYSDAENYAVVDGEEARIALAKIREGTK